LPEPKENTLTRIEEERTALILATRVGSLPEIDEAARCLVAALDAAATHPPRPGAHRLVYREAYAKSVTQRWETEEEQATREGIRAAYQQLRRLQQAARLGGMRWLEDE
jgi:hypothetical protein